MTGHLFDTKCFNETIDLCEQAGVLARVVQWEIGFSVESESSATLQCIGEHEPALDELFAQIEKLCKTKNVKLEPASGPAIDKKILKKIHQDHMH